MTATPMTPAAPLPAAGTLPAVGETPVTPTAGTPLLQIHVVGVPAPQGSKRGFVNPHTGRVAMVESSKKVKPWRKAVAEAATEACAGAAEWLGLDGWVPLDGPLEVAMVFTLRKPLSAPKRTRTWPTKYPDVSKLCRSTEDALTAAGVWADDARVVRYRDLAKVFPGEDPAALSQPGVVVRIWQVAS